MYGYIYKTTNLKNGKIYIGQKKSTHFLSSYLGSGKYLKCAIRYYGIENFHVELIAKADTQKQLNDLEVFYIRAYCATNHDIGYNITCGAVGGDTYSGLSDEDKKLRNEKLSKHKNNLGYKRIHKGDEDKSVPLDMLDFFLQNGWELGISDRIRHIASESHKGIPRTDVWRKRISDTLLNKSNDEKEKLRKLHSESTKRQMKNTPKEVREERARKANKFTGHKCCFVNDGTEMHFIYESELSSYLSRGFNLGMLKRSKKHDI